MDGKIAEGHVLQVRQEKMMTKKVTGARLPQSRKQGGEGGSEGRSSAEEHQGEANTNNGGREDTAGWDTDEQE